MLQPEGMIEVKIFSVCLILVEKMKTTTEIQIGFDFSYFGLDYSGLIK